jgi:hypothetical protein
MQVKESGESKCLAVIAGINGDFKPKETIARK